MRRWLESRREGGKTAQGAAPRFTRYSGAWSTLRKRLQAEPGMRLIDAGATSSTNINYLTSLGHSVYMADLVHDACTGQWTRGNDEDGHPIWDINAFLSNCLDFSGRKFDVVLLWTTLDYLPEPLVAPVVERLHESMNPGGLVLAFFHTRMQGEETANCRFHVTERDEVEVQLSEPFPIQRAFTNRSIERLFSGWAGHRQFLAKDALSEVLMTR